MALNSELFGVNSSGGLGIDAMVPETSEQFDDFSKAIVVSKLTYNFMKYQFKNSQYLLEYNPN